MQFGRGLIDDVVDDALPVIVGIVKIGKLPIDAGFEFFGFHVPHRLFRKELQFHRRRFVPLAVKPHPLNLKTQYSLIGNRFLDGVSMQTLTVKRFRRAGQIAFLHPLIDVKNRRPGKPIPKTAAEEFFNGAFRLRRHRPVTFVHREGDIFLPEFFGEHPVFFRRVRVRTAPDNRLQLLDRRHDRAAVTIL